MGRSKRERKLNRSEVEDYDRSGQVRVHIAKGLPAILQSAVNRPSQPPRFLRR